MVKTFEQRQHRTIRDRAETLALRAALGLARMLPVRMELWLAGRLGRALGRLTGMRARIIAQLTERLPELDARQRARIASDVLDNAGRALAEHFAPKRFAARLGAMTLTGPGWAVIREAAGQRPVILVSAHFGNFHAIRGRLAQDGLTIGGLYRPMNNAAFNEIYLDAMAELAEPIFSRDRRGMAQMVRFLRQRKVLALLVDQYLKDGVWLDFLGHPARTTLTHAELALRYGAELVPVFAVRQPDGVSFDLIAEAPIAHSTPEAMAQAVNDRFSAMIRAHPGQWLWMHRRWKGQP